MSKRITTTRRALLAAVPTVTASMAFPAIAAATNNSNEAQVLAWAAEARRLVGFCNSAAGKALSDDEWDRTLDEGWAYEKLVLQSPCTSRRIALEKLKFGVEASAVAGNRSDGLDVKALKQVIAWMEDQ